MAPTPRKPRKAVTKPASRKAAPRKAAPRKAAPRKAAPRKTAPRKSAPQAARRKPASRNPAAAGARLTRDGEAPQSRVTRAPTKAAGTSASTRRPAAGKQPSGRAAAPPRPRTEAERARQFRRLLHTSCLKAGTAAAVTTLSTRVPLLNRMAPLLVGSMAQSLAVPRIQQQLVLDTLELYGLELSELERQGVVLLATAANVGAQELSRRTVESLVDRVGAPLGRPILDRMLPVTRLVAENAAAIASTYAVGRRAQALCRLSGSGARDVGELLGTITGIDQRQLVEWSTEAAKLALKPFRAALLTLRPRG